MKITLELEDEDYPSLHDTVYEATGYDYNNKELLHIWNGLPELIQLDAAKWGISDTEVRGQIYEYITEKIEG